MYNSQLYTHRDPLFLSGSIYLLLLHSQNLDHQNLTRPRRSDSLFTLTLSFIRYFYLTLLFCDAAVGIGFTISATHRSIFLGTKYWLGGEILKVIEKTLDMTNVQFHLFNIVLGECLSRKPKMLFCLKKRFTCRIQRCFDQLICSNNSAPPQRPPS